MSLVEIRGGAQEQRFVQGAQEVALRLAGTLGRSVVLSSPVNAIEQDDDGVTVRAGSSSRRARAAVVAMPPMAAGRIRYAPALPPSRDALTARFPMGATTKFHVLYPQPFWREAGLSGEAVLTDGPISVVFDNCSHDMEQPALLAFSVGGPARELAMLPEDARRKAVIDALERCFGPKAIEFSVIVEKDWAADEWTRGCPTGYAAPGALSQYGEALREPCGRIHWAGTETAAEWCGYMEGAFASGERAAAEVLARLG